MTSNFGVLPRDGQAGFVLLGPDGSRGLVLESLRARWPSGSTVDAGSLDLELRVGLEGVAARSSWVLASLDDAWREIEAPPREAIRLRLKSRFDPSDRDLLIGRLGPGGLDRSFLPMALTVNAYPALEERADRLWASLTQALRMSSTLSAAPGAPSASAGPAAQTFAPRKGHSAAKTGIKARLIYPSAQPATERSSATPLDPPSRSLHPYELLRRVYRALDIAIPERLGAEDYAELSTPFDEAGRKVREVAGGLG